MTKPPSGGYTCSGFHMGFQSKLGAPPGGILVLAGILASCSGEAVREAPPREDPAILERRLRDEAREALEALERTFYVHWGAVEGTAEYGRLGNAHGPALRETVQANGDLALMALRVLRRRSIREEHSREARAILYVSALGREQNFLRWGIISPRGFVPAVYGRELLGLGPAAAPYLRKLLGDRRRAFVFGDPEGERSNRLQGDRVCDYAWVFLAEIFDRPLAYAEDPRDRDPQIRALDLWLGRRR